jgi:phosphoribosyl-ATP pyrophosphohydrolase/phosphoribosyl-AMP cyclohydrolase
MQPDFDKYPDQLLPCIVQDAQSLQVLMLGFMNPQAFAATQAQGKVVFYSRSKQRLWMKGESSGHTLEVQSMHLDCDQDSLLILAKANGPTCHTGSQSCFNSPSHFLHELEKVIEQYRLGPAKEGSYTQSLLAKGLPKIAQKVGEEAVETIIEALIPNRERLHEEAADLLFHLLVLLQASDTQLENVLAVLRARHLKKISS